MRNDTPVEKLKRIVSMIETDYGKYRQRSEYAFRLGKNKELPRAAMDEVRNAFGHFVDGCALVFLPPMRRTKSKKKSAKAQGASHVWREIHRGRRHLAAAQYYCLIYSLRKRSSSISELLKSPLHDGTPADERYHNRFKEVDASWRTIGAPSERRNLSSRQAQIETKKTGRLNTKLDEDLNKLDRIFLGINKLYKSRYVLGTVSKR